LLNLIAPEDGGALPPLAEDGLVGPKTIGAIRAFQQFHHTANDGRVDPDGPTLKRMNEVPKRALAERNRARLARVVQAMPDLTAMASKGLRTTEAAMDYVRFGQAGLKTSQRAYDLANLYFDFRNVPQSTTLAELAFIRTTFVRVRTVLIFPRPSVTGGDPFGVSIYTIDPLGEDYAAYSPMQLGDDRRDHPDVHSGHVYLCRGLDAKNPDQGTHILLHELFHFVDDEAKEHRIIDHGYREQAMKLTHQQRIHNADNYALFASHVHYGRARLVAGQPTLAPYIPQNL